MNNPKLSVVVTARNDNYGENLINRINTFINVLSSEALENQLKTELVFVEYNPPENQPLFVKVLKIPTNDFFLVRFITIPKSFHLRFATHTKIPLLEYIAKNIGIRRALGEYILAANPDILISNEIFSYIAKNNLKKEVFYRVNRHDIDVDHFNENLSTKQILQKSKEHVYLAWVNDGARYYSWRAWFSRFIHGRNKKSLVLCPLLNGWQDKKQDNNAIHTRAAGDFLLMHRDLWNKVSGYDEVPLSSYLDGYILYVLVCLGAKQEILPFPIYHIDHKVGKNGRPEVAYQKFNDDVKKMTETGIPYRQTDSDWGFPNQKFEEFTK